MTTESPRRTSKFGGIIIKPQPVSDKSVMESVVDFFQDFTLSKAPEDKEKVCWVQFEQLQSNESLVSSNMKANIQNIKDTSGPMMFLILGYMSGAQIWHVAGNGETQEVLTLKKGPIRNLKFLISPTSTTQNDLFSTKRPLIALTDFSGVDQAFTMLRILSLKYGEEVYNIPYQQPVLDILCNYRVLVVAFLQKLEVLDSRNFKPKFSISNCSLSPGINPNPVALSSRWLAYSDKNLSTTHQSGGGVAGEGIQSYTASIICAAKTIKEGITALGETLAGSMTSAQTLSNQKKVASTIQANQSFKKPGIVSIVDVMRSNESEMSVHDDWNGEGLVAHFIAHSSDPITSLTFDPSGTLLMTSDQQGRYFHLFKILIHPQRSSHSTVHHLYVLHRGDTTAKIQSVAFTWDARWVAVSTVHGTTHVFPITSYGGPVNKRTHMSKKVVSRASRFHRSAGLEESFDRFKKSGRDSPAAGVVQGSNPGISGTPSSFSISSVGQQFSASPASPGHLNKEVHLINQLNNPRLPPYPHPTVVHPLAQIRQSCATIPGLDITTPITCSSRQQNKVPTPEQRTVVACFSSSRVLPVSTGSPCVSKERIAGLLASHLIVPN